MFLLHYMQLGFCRVFGELCYSAVCSVSRRKVNVEDGGQSRRHAVLIAETTVAMTVLVPITTSSLFCYKWKP